MATANEIRNHLEQWLQGQVSLRQFQEWFVLVAADVHGKGNPEAEDLVDDIDLSLSEYSDGVLNGSELREELRKLARPFVVQQLRVIAMSAAPPQEVQLGNVPSRKKAHSETAWTVRSFAQSM